jgi:hypothetical protein
LPSTDESRTCDLLGNAARGAELQLDEPRVQRAHLQELLVTAARDDAAVAHDDDPIRLEDGREAVRDVRSSELLMGLQRSGKRGGAE